MKLTNKLGLPAPIVAAVSNDLYTKGDADFSVTELITPPQIVHLRNKHANDIVEDVSDRIWSLLGQSVHSIIERAGLSDATSLSEHTITTIFDGVKIKGQIDHIALDNGTLYDFKLTTVWKLKDNHLPPEWEQQTNIYRYMIEREKNLIINQIAVIALFRDWSKREAARTQGYPSSQAMRLDVPVWSTDRAESFIRQRLALLAEPNPSCTPDDRWERPTRYAIMTKGRTKAVRLFDTLPDAEAALATLPSTHYIEVRPGEPVRCLHYCPVSKFCPQFSNRRETLFDEILG